MSNAQCSCGQLVVSVPGPSNLVVACHCIACQRRTGAPFSVGAFYPAEALTIAGAAKQFSRIGASGSEVHFFFCPDCGATVYWKPDALPAMIGVAVGAFADPTYPAPVRSAFERSKHAWVEIGGVEHFAQSMASKNLG